MSAAEKAIGNYGDQSFQAMSEEALVALVDREHAAWPGGIYSNIVGAENELSRRRKARHPEG